MSESVGRTRDPSLCSIAGFLDHVSYYECGLSIMFKVPFVQENDARNLLSQAPDDLNLVLRKYLVVCAFENRLGYFPKHGIRVTGVTDRTNGRLISLLKEVLNLTVADDRLVSAKLSPFQDGRHPILTSALQAKMHWSERLWDSEKPNDWVDHYQAENVYQDIYRTRELPPNASSLDTDCFGVRKFDLLSSPRTVCVSFDVQKFKFKQSQGFVGSGYSNEEIMRSYPHAVSGLSPAYETNPNGVLRMLRDFESAEFGETPDLSKEDGLVLCLSQHWYRGGGSSASSTQFSDSSQTRCSGKMLEQLSLFILHMGRLYGTVRIWCDFILKTRNTKTEPWEEIGLVPYMIWPTVYISSQTGTPEEKSYNRVWVRIEQFCCSYGRGAFMFSFDLGIFERENPWARSYEKSSILATTTGIVPGRYGGVDETMYLFIRALKHGVFETCLLGSWKSYLEGNLMRWAEREERRISESESIIEGPFIFPDSLAKEKPPPTTLIAAVFEGSNLSGGFKGLKSLLPPTFDSAEISDEGYHDGSFEWARVYPYGTETGEGEEGLSTTRKEYFVITRPSSGYGNCWMCEVLFGTETHALGHLNKIVHYVSSCGKTIPKSEIRSAEEEREISEAGGFFGWFSEAVVVMKRLAQNSADSEGSSNSEDCSDIEDSSCSGRSSDSEWSSDSGHSLSSTSFRDDMLETTVGLPSWDGYGVS